MDIEHLITTAGSTQALADWLGVSYFRVAKWRQRKRLPEAAQLKYKARINRLLKRAEKEKAA